MTLTQKLNQNLLNFTLHSMKFYNHHHAMYYNEKSHIGKCSHLHRLVDWCCRSVFLSHYCLASLQPSNPGQRKRENGRKKSKSCKTKQITEYQIVCRKLLKFIVFLAKFHRLSYLNGPSQRIFSYLINLIHSI